MQARSEVDIYTVYLMVSTQHFVYSDSAWTQSSDTGCLQHSAQCPCSTKATPGNPFCLPTGIWQRCQTRALLPLLLRRTCGIKEGAQAAAKMELAAAPCCAPVPALSLYVSVGLLTYHVDAKGNQMDSSAADTSCVVI